MILPEFLASMNKSIVDIEDGVVTISKTCTVTVVPYTVRVPEALYKRWKAGEHIQDLFPNLSADEREFVITGITPAEWARDMGGEED